MVTCYNRLTDVVLTSAHNLCYKLKYELYTVYTCKPMFYNIHVKVGSEGGGGGQITWTYARCNTYVTCCVTTPTTLHGVQRKMVSVDICFVFFEIIIFCFVVAICDLVHAVKAVYSLP